MRVVSHFLLNCHSVICYYDPGNNEETNSVNESNMDKHIEHKVRAFSFPL